MLNYIQKFGLFKEVITDDQSSLALKFLRKQDEGTDSIAFSLITNILQNPKNYSDAKDLQTYLLINYISIVNNRYNHLIQSLDHHAFDHWINMTEWLLYYDHHPIK